MLIYGKEIREQIKQRVENAASTRPMALAVVSVGEDPASQAYIKGIRRFAEDTGVQCNLIKLPEQCTEEELLYKIEALNQDESVTGIMLQTPLPRQINADRITKAIYPGKDVEGIHVQNLGHLVNRTAWIKPSTPKAVVHMLKSNDIELKGARVTIIGRSAIVGTPLALMLMDEDATVTLCHSRTRDLKKISLESDILIAAAGQENLVTDDMVHDGMVIIDVGTNYNDQGKMVGDVSHEAKERARIASAVPGGVGTITVAELFDNLCILAEQV